MRYNYKLYYHINDRFESESLRLSLNAEEYGNPKQY